MATPRTILIVDDDAVTLQILGTSLKHIGYRVVSAMDAMQCLMAARRNEPEAILLDVQLPGGGGIEALKKLKTNSQTQMIPVIAISSSNEAALPARVLALGAESFLHKPIDLALLSETLRGLLDPSSADPDAASAGPT